MASMQCLVIVTVTDLNHIEIEKNGQSRSKRSHMLKILIHSSLFLEHDRSLCSCGTMFNVALVQGASQLVTRSTSFIFMVLGLMTGYICTLLIHRLV